jgi:DNA-binding XRE family transcriptional regulator
MRTVYLLQIIPIEPMAESILKIGHCIDIDDRIKGIRAKYPEEKFIIKIKKTFRVNKSTALNLENLCKNGFKGFLDTVDTHREYFYCCSLTALNQAEKYFSKNISEHISSMKPLSNLQDCLGVQIKAKRYMKNMTQKQLADISEVRQADISALENGKIGHYKTLKKVLDALGMCITLTDI